MTYALDTNIVSYILRGNSTVIQRMIRESELENIIVIPLIVYYEIKRGLVSSGATVKLDAFESLCANFDVNNMNTHDMDTAATIYAENKRKGSPAEDTALLIAADCIANGYTLVTNNVKHFEHTDGLRFVNWG